MIPMSPSLVPPTFPLTLSLNLDFGKNSAGLGPDGTSIPQKHQRTVVLYSGLTMLIGPNGSGKTHLLRAIQRAATGLVPGKNVRFISAGRIGMMEQYRSIYSTGSHVPQYEQARLGNWHEREQRHRLETLEGDYQTIAARPDIQLKIRERLKKLFNRDFSLNWENSQLKVEFFSGKLGSSPYSAGREASGLIHLAGLLAAIYDDHTGILLIDEPEVSLHPQLQAFLLREITNVAGQPGIRNKKIIVISTHSTEFLQVESPLDLPNLIFTEEITKPPIQIDPNASELKNRKIAELISRMGQEHKLAFFAKAPLLVEGPSDTIICAGLASKLDIHVEAGGSQLLPVVGKGQFPVVVKLLRLMGKTPMVLADADAFTDGNELVLAFSQEKGANDAAVERSHADLMSMHKAVYAAFVKQTLTDWTSIQATAEQTWYWKQRDAEGHEQKTRRRAAFSAMFSNETTSLPKQWQRLKTQIAGFLDVLEAGGCFILRKGTIESYYSSADAGAGGKPSAATDEVIAFKARDEASVREQYDDILRCMVRAASAEDISEADVIRDSVISIAGPLVAKMRDGSAENNDLNAIAASSGITLAKLFDLREQDGKLVINLNSSILDINCFPMTIDPQEDVVTKVSQIIAESRNH